MKKYFLIVLSLLLTVGLQAQNIDRLEVLENQIAVYADSIPQLKEEIDISVSATSLKEFLRAVAELHNLNVSLDQIPDYLITNNFEKVTIEEVLVFLCSKYDLEIKVLNNIIIIYSEAKEKEVLIEYKKDKDLLSFHFTSDTLRYVAKVLADSTHYNLILSNNVRNKVVHGFVKDLTFEIALQQLAVSNDLKLEKKGEDLFYLSLPDIIEEEVSTDRGNPKSASTQRRSSTSRRSSSSSRKSSNDEELNISKHKTEEGILSIDASAASVSDAIKKVCIELNKDYFFLEEPQGTLDCHLVNVNFEDFLNVALATGTPQFSYSVRNGIYVIGSPKNLDINEATVYVFKNRSVEEVATSIPTGLKTDIEINEYLDLNALVLTGSEQRVNKLVDFLKQIDKPVANVLIEVMVVVINKGALLETGISAGVSDSVSFATEGEVFSGLDLTLNSSSLNNFLESIDRRGIIKIGRVTPNFYANIKALEAANFLDTQSTPKLSAVNGHEASMTIGRSVYYLVETQNITGGVNAIITTTPRYEQVEANLELKIKPFVSYNEDVTLTISFESSEFIEPTVEGAPPGSATRMFESKIRVKNEEMIVLGGLETESVSETNRGLPVIAKWPVFKWIFGQNSKSNSTNKLIVFIKPTVIY